MYWTAGSHASLEVSACSLAAIAWLWQQQRLIDCICRTFWLGILAGVYLSFGVCTLMKLMWTGYFCLWRLHDSCHASDASLMSTYPPAQGAWAFAVGGRMPGVTESNPGLQELVFGCFGLPLGLGLIVICGGGDTSTLLCVRQSLLDPLI